MNTSIPPGAPGWPGAVDLRLVRRLLARRPRLAEATRRGLDRLTLAERTVPVSLRLARRGRRPEEDQEETPLPVVAAIGRSNGVAGPGRGIVVRPRRPAEREPRLLSGTVRGLPGGLRTHADGGLSPAAPVHREPVPPGPPIHGPVPRSTGLWTTGGVAVPVAATAVVPERPSRLAGAALPPDVAGGGAPGSAPAPPRPRVRPVRPDLRPITGRRAAAPGGRPPADLPAPARPVVRPRPVALPDAVRGSVPVRASVPPSRRPRGVPGPAGPHAGVAEPAGEPMSLPAPGGAVVQKLSAGATVRPDSGSAGPDVVVEQVLRRLGRQFAVSAERRGLRAARPGGEPDR